MTEKAVPSLREQLADVPHLPGVYLWKDQAGTVIYVGKARDLRDRMRQYVQQTDERAMIPRLMEQATSFDYVVTENEHESLILEKNLIHQFSPHFNVDFKDDKSYPYIALTIADKYPALKYTREKHQAGSRYFGPFTDARAARTLIEVARRVTPICLATCDGYKRLQRRLASNPQANGDKPCFNYHVGLGPGPCIDACSSEEYARQVERVARFLAGHRRAFIAELETEMQTAAADLDFERAARARDRIEIIHSLEDRQHVVLAGNLEADVIGFYREETIAGVQVLSVREGRIQLANEFVLDKGLDVGDDELIRSFLLRYYESASTIPKFVFLAKLPEDSLLIADWLSGLRSAKPGARVRLQVPRQGPKRQVVLMAEQNAHHALNRFKVRSRYDEERSNLALLQLESALVLPRPPLRIECFDISTIHGQYSVGSMVVFAGGQPEKAAYRRFRIRQTSGEANDVAMMGEVLRRRYAAERQSDARFGSRPDLIIVDGGLPQLHAAQEVLREMDCTDIPIAGLAKADEELFMDWSGSAAIRLPGGSAALYLVKQIRDEAHRFAIGYHRELRGKSMRQSLLDNIPGVGPQRQQALLKAFGSLRQLRQSSVEQISAVPGISATLAQKIWEFWQRPTIDSSRDDQPPSA